jgi:hypothetical protein
MEGSAQLSGTGACSRKKPKMPTPYRGTARPPRDSAGQEMARRAEIRDFLANLLFCRLPS